MPKNIVLCFEGTGSPSSNVLKLFSTLVRDSHQLTYYHPGIGTMGARNALTSLAKWWTRILGLAFGYGITDDVADAYSFLMRVFEPDDRIFVFGFSRGAYAVQVLCGMLHMIGLLREDHEHLIPYAIRFIKTKKMDAHLFKRGDLFKQLFSRECKPYFVGLWDSVGSVGWIYSPAQFVYTSTSPDPQIVRHAVSIDERRCFYQAHTYGNWVQPGQDSKEVWFAGVHSDIGGGSYLESESQLSKIALKWILSEAEHAGLQIEPTRKIQILGEDPSYVTFRQHESLTPLWWILEFLPRTAVTHNSQGIWRRSLTLGLGKRRYIPDGALIHDSVLQLLNSKSLKYRPPNLPRSYLSERDYNLLNAQA